MDLNDLKKFSLLTYGLERLFFFLQYLSPANLLFGTRAIGQKAEQTDEERKQIAIKRGPQIELYQSIWIVLEGLCGFGIVFQRERLSLIITSLMLFRIFEIVQAAANMNIFDRLRFGGRVHYTSTLARTLLMSCINFIEIIVCFGVVYAGNLALLKDGADPATWRDAFYFSTITQLTIGYGDVTPKGILRFCAAAQGIIGFFFALIVLSRFVSFLPRTQAVFGDGDVGT
jgi:potassium channel LctB